MESNLFTADYLLTCFITILVVVTGIFGPQSMEKSMPPGYSSDDASKFHCHMFAWPMLVGGLGLLFGALFGWTAMAMVICGELVAFGASYFIGLLAHEHDKENFARRCRAVCKRYREELSALFGKRDLEALAVHFGKPKKTPDLQFLKNLEAHAGTTPEKVVRMRIRHMQTFLSGAGCTGDIESMVQAYVRAGGRA